MYFYFEIWQLVMDFLKENPDAKIVGSETNITKPQKFIVFVPLKTQRPV